MKKRAFSSRPFSILDRKERDSFTSVMEILLLETGDRAACEQWQEQQLVALVNHAKKRSGFWRNRTGLVKPSLANLKFLPILTRTDLTIQVTTEGALLTKADGIPYSIASTSGSSGTPVEFYASAANVKYNGMRMFAQDLIEQRDLTANVIKIDLSIMDTPEGQKKTFTVKTTRGRFGPLNNVFEGGVTKAVKGNGDVDALIKELRKQVPYSLICVPSVMDLILNEGGVELLKELGVKRWIQLSEARSFRLDKKFKDADILISANYSAEETGPIANECSYCPGHYHVATSNVIIETDESVTTEVDGETLSRVLVTHLHSYATPIIRYDIGDFAKLSQTCNCGHEGPTLSHIYGRAKRFIYFPDGSYVPFQFRAKNIFERVECREFQIHQKDFNTIVVRIGGREKLSEKEVRDIEEFIHYKADKSFKVEIRPVTKIDWQDNPKKLGFTSSVA